MYSCLIPRFTVYFSATKWRSTSARIKRLQKQNCLTEITQITELYRTLNRNQTP